jgi:hypothetical protein
MSNYNSWDELKSLQDSKADARDAITHFLVYLESSKFKDDPTIQASEVHRFLMDLRLVLA